MRVRPLLIFALMILAAPAAAQCRLCAPAGNSATEAPAIPLSIEVETALDFSRAAHARTGGGSIAIDERSGTRRLSGLIDLGGPALQGTVRLKGAPYARVRVSLPPAIRLTASDGGTAEVVDLRTDLSPAPVLDANGMLGFAFAGRLIVPGTVSGSLRGRVAIVAVYE